ncbi:alkyl/aryl-sulfatase [Shewanella youngdeokensis]|uniref:Alkyl/aryl-sulfatase n=1 Tax=Shewanella youngdeokensis TaxID=2999068 RepID=A0ABZ0JZK2_9GAMM|nr:alkyl/aryl-sulfatase [Shewanella sp. DAU334]
MNNLNPRFKKSLIGLALVCSFAAAPTMAGTQVAPEKALALLDVQAEQFTKQIVKISDNVYTAVGYHGANTSMIVGDDGVIIIDTLMGPASATNAWNELQKFSGGKPVKAIIYTHSHGDHTGGAAVFAGDDNPEVIARVGFGGEHGANKLINPILIPRGVRQFGRKLPADQETHRGLAPAKTLDHDRGKGHIKPTLSISEDVYRTTIAGVELELHAAPGETDDAQYIWLPKEQVLFAGDNFYRTFPNLYAIRGTPYRDVTNWSNSVKKMADHNPKAVIGGHTIPVLGQKAATAALTNYSAAIRSVYDQTVAGINQGKSPNLIAHEVELPAELKKLPYLTEFYGTVPHAVRAIYAGLLGWYDGNPTTLNPLAPADEAQKLARLAGGTKALTKQMDDALKAGEFQWALELADNLMWLKDAPVEKVRTGKVKALRGLAAREYNAPNRNYYLSYANELEQGKLQGPWF